MLHPYRAARGPGRIPRKPRPADPSAQSETRTVGHASQSTLGLEHRPILQQRQQVLDVAYQLHPERFVRQAPKQPAIPTEV